MDDCGEEESVFLFLFEFEFSGVEGMLDDCCASLLSSWRSATQSVVVAPAARAAASIAACN